MCARRGTRLRWTAHRAGRTPLVPGLLLGRPRWPWLAARAALNVPMAAYVLHRGGKGPRARNARAFALTITTATIGDLNAAIALFHD